MHPRDTWAKIRAEPAAEPAPTGASIMDLDDILRRIDRDGSIGGTRS